MRRFIISDTDREEWTDNDEQLYAWRRESRLSKRQFVRTYRAEIDSYIRARNQHTDATRHRPDLGNGERGKRIA